jgi:hypothetical protein
MNGTGEVARIDVVLEGFADFVRGAWVVAKPGERGGDLLHAKFRRG